MIKDSNGIIITNENYNQRIEELDKLRQDQYIIDYKVKSIMKVTGFIDSLDDNVKVSNYMTNSRKDETDQLAEQIDIYQKAFDEYLNKIEEDERKARELLDEIQKEIDEGLSRIEEFKRKTNQFETKRINTKRQIENYNIRKAFIKQFLSKDYSNTIKNTKEKTDIGSVITFGSYMQDNRGHKKTPIEWIILDRQDEKALIISKYALDCKPYNETRVNVTWECSSLRKWLNGIFINNAFTTNDQKIIQSTNVTADRNPSNNTDPGNDTTDKVFLLSINEAKKLLPTSKDRACEPTDYAVAQGSWKFRSDGNCWWWLRSPGSHSNYAAYVYFGGDIRNSGFDVNYNKLAVRPAMWVKFDSK